MSRNLARVHTVYTEDRSFANVRDEVKSYIEEGKAVICPCCNQFAMMNTRKITPAMARQARQLAKAGVPMDAKQLQLSNDGRERMYSLLRFWGLIDKTEGHSWVITDLGLDFVAGKIEVAKFAYVYNNELVALDQKEFVSFSQCLGNEFDLPEVFSTEEKVNEERL